MKKSTLNTFNKGLILDVNPIMAGDLSLSYALNAAIYTNNGNEGSLLNDMGNAQVKDVNLPEGYAPIGTCEYGGIIYIISYNPKTGYSQIGSFPSPQILDETNKNHFLKKWMQDSDFLAKIDANGEDIPLNYKIVRYSKLLEVSEDYIHPGDKYLFYSTAVGDDEKWVGENVSGLKKNGEETSGYIKITPVAIEDSGKIVELFVHKSIPQESSGNDYFIFPSKDGSIGSDDFSDNYELFSSKIPGKLALKFELIALESFNVSHDIEDEGENYKVIFTITWRGLDNLLDSILLNGETINFENTNWNSQSEDATQSKIPIQNSIDFTHKKAVYIMQYPKPRSDDSINHNIDYIFTPVLQYAILDNLEYKDSIDYSKINSAEYSLTKWKYYNSDDYSTIAFELKLYPLLTKIIDHVDLEFYDPFGQAFTYKLKDLDSYSGNYIIDIPFDGKSTKSEMELTDYHVGSPFKISEVDFNNTYNIVYYSGKDKLEKGILKGGKVFKSEESDNEIIPLDSEGNKFSTLNDSTIYINDTGILWSNRCYLVFIKVYERSKNNEGGFELAKTFLRIYWTNKLFNKHYYNSEYTDFDDCPFELELDSGIEFEITDAAAPSESSTISTDKEVGILEEKTVNLTLNVYSSSPEKYELTRNDVTLWIGRDKYIQLPAENKGYLTYNLKQKTGNYSFTFTGNKNPRSGADGNDYKLGDYMCSLVILDDMSIDITIPVYSGTVPNDDIMIPVTEDGYLTTPFDKIKEPKENPEPIVDTGRTPGVTILPVLKENTVDLNPVINHVELNDIEEIKTTLIVSGAKYTIRGTIKNGLKDNFNTFYINTNAKINNTIWKNKDSDLKVNYEASAAIDDTGKEYKIDKQTTKLSISLVPPQTEGQDAYNTEQIKYIDSEGEIKNADENSMVISGDKTFNLKSELVVISPYKDFDTNNTHKQYTLEPLLYKYEDLVNYGFDIYYNYDSGWKLASTLYWGTTKRHRTFYRRDLKNDNSEGKVYNGFPDPTIIKNGISGPYLGDSDDNGVYNNKDRVWLDNTIVYYPDQESCMTSYKKGGLGTYYADTDESKDRGAKIKSTPENISLLLDSKFILLNARHLWFNAPWSLGIDPSNLRGLNPTWFKETAQTSGTYTAEPSDHYAVGYIDDKQQMHLTNTFYSPGLNYSVKSKVPINPAKELGSLLAQVYRVVSVEDATTVKRVYYPEKDFIFASYIILRSNCSLDKLKKADIESLLGGINIGEYKYSDYIERLVLLVEEEKKGDLRDKLIPSLKESIKTFPLNFKITTQTPDLDISVNKNTRVNTLLGADYYLESNPLRGLLYSFDKINLLEINEDSPTVNFDLLNGYMLIKSDSQLSNKITIYNREGILLTSTNFGKIFKFKNNKLYLSHNSYNNNDEYFRYVCDFGGWCDCRYDETIIDGHSYDEIN